MLLYISDLCVRTSEWVVDRLNSLHLMQVWVGGIGSKNEVKYVLKRVFFGNKDCTKKTET